MSRRPEEQPTTTHTTQRSQSGENLVEQGEWVNAGYVKTCSDVGPKRSVRVQSVIAASVKDGTVVSIEATERVLSAGRTRMLDSY